MKEDKRFPSSTGGGDGAGDGAGRGQPALDQDSLSLIQVKKLVLETPRLNVFLINVSSLRYARVRGNQLECYL